MIRGFAIEDVHNIPRRALRIWVIMAYGLDQYQEGWELGDMDLDKKQSRQSLLYALLQMDGDNRGISL